MIGTNTDRDRDRVQQARELIEQLESAEESIRKRVTWDDVHHLQDGAESARSLGRAELEITFCDWAVRLCSILASDAPKRAKDGCTSQNWLG